VVVDIADLLRDDFSVRLDPQFVNVDRVNMMAIMDASLPRLSAAQAAARLGVRQQTLYAYVSRGLLSRERGAHGSTFDALEVEAFASSRRRSAAPATNPTASGSPLMVLDTDIALIEDGELYFRGVPAADLALMYTYESVARWLWGGPLSASGGAFTTDPDATAAARAAVASLPASATSLDRLQVAVPVLGASDPTRHDLDPTTVRAVGERLIAGVVATCGSEPVRDAQPAPRQKSKVAINELSSSHFVTSRVDAGATDGARGAIVGAATGAPEAIAPEAMVPGDVASDSLSRPVEKSHIAISELSSSHFVTSGVGVDGDGEGAADGAATADAGTGPDTLASRLWRAFAGRAPDATELRALNAALVLLVDHDLAVSTLAARAAASARATPYAVVSSGLGALDSALHGNASGAAAELIRLVLDGTDARTALAQTVARTARPVPGFGQPLYPGIDARAGILLPLVADLPDGARVVDAVERLAGEVLSRTGRHPNVDLALAALTTAAGMRPDAGAAIFAIGRMGGWIAHAIDEYDQRPLRLRPRGRYVGPAASSAADVPRGSSAEANGAYGAH
jgi:citrate synthase